MTILIVDGRARSVLPGRTILESCREHGIAIPTLCHLDGLPEASGCRLCVVGAQGLPRPVAACSTRARDGMVVSTATARLQAHRRGVVEMLLASGRHVCAFCPASGRRTSPAFAEAISWETGQMPQTREVSAGSSRTSRPTQSASNPRSCSSARRRRPPPAGCAGWCTSGSSCSPTRSPSSSSPARTVARPLEAAAREAILAELPGALAAARRTLDGWWRRLPALADEARACEEPEGHFLALLGPGGELEHYDGTLRVVSAGGSVVDDAVDPARYAELIGEHVEPWSYAKLAYRRPLGYPAGVYRVGPLARLNAASRCGTPLADAELARFRTLGSGPVLSTFHAHAARLVEIVFALERMEELLADPGILGDEVLASPSGVRGGEGVGACEAPRGTLFHHYRADAGGVMTFVDLVVATGLNALAMNRAVRRAAERWLGGERVTDALLGRVEAAVRAFDPCLSCAAHAAGSRSVALRLTGPRGEVLAESAERLS